MEADRSDSSSNPVTIQNAVRRAVEPMLAYFEIPGVVVAWAKGDAPPTYLAAGTDAAGRALLAESLFPVASLTKLATALAVLRLVDAGRLALDESLGTYLPDAAAALPGVTLRMLLSHTGGLPEDLAPETAPYAEGLTWRALADACLKTRLERAPFTRVTYSNVGYGLLAIAVEREMRMSFPDALGSLVLKPLGVEAYLGVEPPRPPVVVSDVRGEHARTPLEPYNSPFWRSLGVPWGGLITTPAGALNLARAFHAIPPDFLSPGLRAESIRSQTGDLGGGYGRPFVYARCPWGLGPDLRDEKKPHWAPAESSPATFGHAGASGAVVWCDPQRDLTWAVLGSRTADNGWLLRASPAIGRALLDNSDSSS